jgi:pyruvate,water dikinase
MLRPVFIVALIMYCISAIGQVIYNGHIYDAGTQTDVLGAEIQLINQGQQTTSNTFGNFVLKYGNADDSNFQFFNNSMVWNGEKSATVQIIGLDGSLLYAEKISGGETYLFPRLQTGLYVIKILEGNTINAYKIMSDGTNTIKVDKRGIFHQYNGQSVGNDTLRIVKEGYYPREIILPSHSKIIKVAMLKGDYEKLDYFNELVEPVAFDLISGKAARTNLGDVKGVKIVYDIKRDRIYYMNSKKYELHLDFAVQVLGFDKGHLYFNQTQYTDNPQREYYLAGLNYFEGIDKYVLQYVSAVEMNCDQIDQLYNKILNTSFIEKEQLYFFPNKTEWLQCTNTNHITSEELYQGQNYQGLNEASNYGYLRKITSSDLESAYVSRRDIVLTDGVPNDLPVVAGIITSELQTPLSHINVLSHSRNTPNMALRQAWESEEFNALIDQLVFLKVEAEKFEIRQATLEEANAYWLKREPQDTIYLRKNITYFDLPDMPDVGFTCLDRVGGKASNFGELLNVQSITIPTPENAFAIPFYYYDQHIKRYGLDQMLAEMMANLDFKSNAAMRKIQLELLRDSILNSPIDPNLVTMVEAKIGNFSSFDSYRFRSSTNAEDLEDFSGAGLYDSFSAKKGSQSKSIEIAIKSVWASLWNWRAFEERSYFKIDHFSCAMGILVHRSFPDEDANGVLITKNLYNFNPGYTINSQYKEHSIVFPEPGIIHDQMILFTWSINPGEEFMLEYLAFSNVPELGGERVMTDEEVFQLGRYATQIKRRFYYDLPHNCDCAYNDFGVDIEFKVDSDVSPRKIYIKQARLYK